MLYLYCSLVFVQLIHFAYSKGRSTSLGYVQVVAIGTRKVDTETVLKCSFSKISAPEELFWYFGEDIIWSNRLQLIKKYEVSNEDFRRTRRHMLKISMTKAEDSGTYKCVVKDSKHYYNDQVKIAVKPNDVLTKPGSTTLIKCSSLEVLPNTIWMKGYSLIPRDQTNSPIHVLSNGSLQIRNFTRNEVGTYSCFSEGKKVNSWTISSNMTPVKDLSPLRGWRGIFFGVVIGVVIVLFLFVACFIQYATLDAIKYRREQKRELKSKGKLSFELQENNVGNTFCPST